MTQQTLEYLDKNLIVRLIRACHTILRPGIWRYQYTNDTFWRFYFNGQDGASVTTLDGTIALQPGRAYIIPSHLVIDLSCSNQINHFYAHFDVLGLPDIALRQLFRVPFCHPDALHIEQVIEKSTSGLRPEAPDGGRPVGVAAQCWIKSIIYEVLAQYLQTIPLEQIDACWHLVQRMELVMPAVTYIEAHLAEELPNLLLAQACGMSEGHFIRTFRDCMGQTPSQYVIECRVKAASQRLLLSSDSIDQIAEECGFGSRDYFSRIFARQTGQPPAAFRRSHGANASLSSENG